MKIKDTPYKILVKYMPRDYRHIIAKETGDSLSHIDKVLRNERPDTKGVLIVAYRLAAEEAKNKKKVAKEINFLKSKLKTHVA